MLTVQLIDTVLLLYTSFISKCFRHDLFRKKIENPSKEHHRHFWMGRKHPKHTRDNLLHVFRVSSASWFQSKMAAAAQSLLEDWAVWMLSLQRCLVWSSVLVLSFLPVWSKPDQGNWSFPSWVALPKLQQAGQPTLYLLVPCSACLDGFFFFPTLLFSNSSRDASDVRTPNNYNQKAKKPQPKTPRNSNPKPFNV